MAERIIELDITGLTAKGDGLGRHNGLAVFVPGALPGERVRAGLEQVKKNYARAMLTEILRQSGDRVLPACPFFAKCGGCVLQHLAYKEQLVWKRRWLKDALLRVGGLKAEVLPAIGAKRQTGYRDRAQLHCAWQNGRLKLGFFAHGSHELTKGASCLLLRPLLTRIARLLTELPPHTAELLAPLRHAALRCDSRGEQAMLTLVGEMEQPGQKLLALAAGLMEREPRLVSVWANRGKAVYGIYGANWCKLAGAEKLPDSMGDLRLSVSPGAFTQINSPQARMLYEGVAHYAALSGCETVLDAYSGVGSVALYLADKALFVTGVEEYAPAVADAVANAKLNGITNCRFTAGRAEDVLPRLKAKGFCARVAVVDPPRAGCAAPALKALAEIKPKRIVYVSCDPATLARDARQLALSGYTLTQAQPLDMFPHTGHVEAIALLQRPEL